jgi:ureidoglycolate hydrolase
MKELKAVELTGESFKDYGYVVSSVSGEPMADNAEFKYWGKVSELKMSEFASTGVLLCLKRELIVKQFERHVHTPEMLVALEGNSIICFAKPSVQGKNQIEAIRAFKVKQGTAIAVHEGAWHWIPYPVDCKESKFLVVFASGTEANDLEVKELDEEITIIA